MSSLRFGLCCLFSDNSPRFRQATHTYVSKLTASARREYMADVVHANAIALVHAIARCAELGIGAFRINSQIAPLGTHPRSGYELGDLLRSDVIIAAFQHANAAARANNIRLSFHPDQFVVLNSERADVVASSITELEFQARLAELIGADTICLHGGGMAGGPDAALDRLRRGIDRLSGRVRARLAFENDDRSFTVQMLLPLCEREQLPVIYDVHHHRCLPDGLSVDEATDLAAATWTKLGREPYMHISSPRDGWAAKNPRPHSDFIDPNDLPPSWLNRTMTVDVEAKAKERAVVQIIADARTRRAALAQSQRSG
jgi:UV DNA damage endonuclease